MPESLIFLFVGLLIGLFASVLIIRFRKTAIEQGDKPVIDVLRANITEYRDNIAGAEIEIRKLTAMVAERDTNLLSLAETLDKRKKEIVEMQETMKKEFRLMANEIMEDKSQKFTKENSEKLDQVLKPFNDNLKDFRDKVEQTRIENIEGRASLFAKLGELEKLNARVGDEANALTKALKGDSKAQGNWGEMILESILEKSGLVKDREFFVQESFTTDGGRRLQPDIIVKYPGDRSIIIDSKVSLLAYEQYVNADNDEKRKVAIKAHLTSVRAHLNKLSVKDYQGEYQVNTIDFVMMFMPIEPAYFMALQMDDRLWSDAYEKRILLISPTNLIAALKMIESIWKQEYQSRNVVEIARQGGALYDDFVSLLERLEKLGKRINQTQKQYDETVMKLTGRGNLINRVGSLRELGVKAKKEMPDKFKEDELTEPS